MSRHPRGNEDTEPGVLKRWSRRKARSGETPDTHASQAGEHPETVAGPGGETPSPDDRAPDAGAAEPVKTDEDMPDLESINDASDMRDFFSPGVSEQLRNQALRRLFRTARFNVIDPLDDYNEDFRNFELLGDLVTSDMRHRMDMDEQRRKEAAEADDASREAEPADAASVEDSEEEEPEDFDETTVTRRNGEEPAGSDGGETDTNSDSGSRKRT